MTSCGKKERVKSLSLKDFLKKRANGLEKQIDSLENVNIKKWKKGSSTILKSRKVLNNFVGCFSCR